MIEIQIDTRAIDSALLELGRHVDDLTPAMRAIGESLAGEIDLTFRNQQDPYGNPWAELADSTKAKRRKGPRPANDQILKDTGQLKALITSNPSRHEVQIGTNELYGRTHQFGATQGQYGKTRRNSPIPWGNVPARPFLPTEGGGLPHDWEQDILAIIRRHIEAAI
jgi:phage virion morphogenesis protein